MNYRLCSDATPLTEGGVIFIQALYGKLVMHSLHLNCLYSSLRQFCSLLLKF
mgnify:CR=1 FL=1